MRAETNAVSMERRAGRKNRAHPFFRSIGGTSKHDGDICASCANRFFTIIVSDDLTEVELRGTLPIEMLQVKDTLRSTVQVSFDGRVYKTYHGPTALERFNREVEVLRYLESRACPFVPRLLEADRAKLRIITSHCGIRVEHLDPERARALFAELEGYGVRHDDPDIRNVTYRQSDGRFCVVDFELASMLPGPT